MVRSGQCCLRGPEVTIGVPSNIATTQLWFAVFCSGRCFRDLSGCSFVTGCGWSGTSNLLLEPQASSRREELQYDREGGPRLGRSCEGLFSVLRRSTSDGLDGPFTSPLHRIHEQAQSSARLTQQAIQCLTPVSHLRRRRTHILCDSHLQVVEPRLPIRAKTLLCVVAGGKSVHRATPSCASTRPRGGSHALRGEVCYVYSLPPCYFTQSALPIYQTGCCSVCYTCDLSRVTDCARCRLFTQL